MVRVLCFAQSYDGHAQYDGSVTAPIVPILSLSRFTPLQDIKISRYQDIYHASPPFNTPLTDCLQFQILNGK